MAMARDKVDIEHLLIKAGIQPTAQRLAICRYVIEDADHPTADDVKTWMDANFPKVSLATVYNTLKLLVAKGVLQELHFPHQERAVYDCNTGNHHHFVDVETGRMIDLDESEISVMAKLGADYEILRTHAVVTGRKRI